MRRCRTSPRRGRPCLDGRGRKAVNVLAASIVLALIVLVSCSRRDAYDPEDARRHVGFLDRALEQSCHVNGLRQWAWFRGEPLDTSPIPGGKLAYFDHDWFRRWRGHIPEPVLARQVSLMYRQTLAARFDADPVINRLAARLVDRLKAFRPELNGRPTRVSAIRAILAGDPDPGKRKAAWLAFHAAAGRACRDDVRKLVKRRNEVARALGYTSFYRAWLDANGLGPEEVRVVLKHLEDKTGGPYRDRYVAPARNAPLAPWDIPYLNHDFRAIIAGYLGADALLSRVNETLEDMGFGEALKGIMTDAKEREGRPSHYFTFPVGIPGDIRVLVTPGRGIDPYRLTFHEYGHALYYQEVRQRSFVFRLPSAAPYAEGLAKVFERVPYRPGWLEAYAGVPEPIASEAAQYNRNDELVKIRRFLAWCEFERRLYEAPSEDPTDTYWEAATRLQSVEPGHREPVWAADIHLVTQPFSSLSYVMARLIQAQIHRAMRARFGAEFGGTDTGTYLKERFYRPGASKDWRVLIEEATGSALSPTPYIQDELGL